MASGGFRGTAGRPPDPSSLASARGKNDDAWVVLEPASGVVPEWPLEGFSAREAVWWERLWLRPQASKWAELMLEDSVALYVRYLAEAELPDATANIRNIVKQYQEYLGLSTAGLRAQRWVMPDEGVSKVQVAPKSSKRASSRTRLKVVGNDG